MKQLLIPITNPYFYNNHIIYSHHSHGGGGSISLEIAITAMIILSILYICYLVLTLFERDMSDRNDRLFVKREFILDLVIPFRGWFIWLKDLFKDKE